MPLEGDPNYEGPSDSLDDFASLEAKLVKLAHFLGLKDTPAGDNENRKLLKLTGNYPHTSIVWIKEYLLHFQKNSSDLTELENKIVGSLINAFDEARKLRPNYPYSDEAEGKTEEQIVDSIIKKFRNNELVQIPAGWATHGVGLALINNRLIYTNTGRDSSPFTGTLIYKIDPDKIDRNVLKKFRLCDNSTELKEHIVATCLEEKPIYHFHEYQKVGNCTVSNPKKSMEEAIACLLVLEKSQDKVLESADILAKLKELDETEKNKNLPYIKK